MKKTAKILMLILAIVALVGTFVFAASAEDNATESGFIVRYTTPDGTMLSHTFASNNLLDIWTDSSFVAKLDLLDAGAAANKRHYTSTARVASNDDNYSARIDSIELKGVGETYTAPYITVSKNTELYIKLNGNTLVVNERFEVSQEGGQNNEGTCLIIDGADSDGNRGTITNVGGMTSVQLFQNRPGSSLFVYDTEIILPGASGNFMYDSKAQFVYFGNCKIDTYKNLNLSPSTVSISTTPTYVFQDTEYIYRGTAEPIIISTGSNYSKASNVSTVSGPSYNDVDIYFTGDSKIDISATQKPLINHRAADIDKNYGIYWVAGEQNVYVEKGVLFSEEVFRLPNAAIADDTDNIPFYQVKNDSYGGTEYSAIVNPENAILWEAYAASSAVYMRSYTENGHQNDFTTYNNDYTFAVAYIDEIDVDDINLVIELGEEFEPQFVNSTDGEYSYVVSNEGVSVTVDGEAKIYALGTVFKSEVAYGTTPVLKDNSLYYVGFGYLDADGNALTSDVTLELGKTYVFTTETFYQALQTPGYTIKYVLSDGTTGEYLVLSDDIFAFLDDDGFKALGVAALSKAGQYNVPVNTYGSNGHITEIIYHNVDGKATTYTGCRQSNWTNGTTSTTPHYKLWIHQTHSLVLDLGGNTWNYDGGIVMGNGSGNCHLTIKNGTINIDRLSEKSSNSQFIQSRQGSTLIIDNITSSMSYGQYISDSGASNIVIKDSAITLGGSSIALKDVTNDYVNNFIIDKSTVAFTVNSRIDVQSGSSAKNSWNFYILNGSKVSTGTANFINVAETVGTQAFYIEEGTRMSQAGLVKLDATKATFVESIEYTLEGYVSSAASACTFTVGDAFTDAIYLDNGAEDYRYSLTSIANAVTVIINGETAYFLDGHVIKAETVQSEYKIDTVGIYTVGIRYKNVDTGEFIDEDVTLAGGNTYSFVVEEDGNKTYMENVAFAIFSENGAIAPYAEPVLTHEIATQYAGKYDVVLFTNISLDGNTNGKKVNFPDTFEGTFNLNGYNINYSGQQLVLGTSSNKIIEGEIKFINGSFNGGGLVQVRPGKTLVFDGLNIDGTWNINDGGAYSFLFNNCIIDRGAGEGQIVSRQTSAIEDLVVNFNGCTFKGDKIGLVAVVGMYQTATTPTVDGDNVYHTVNWAAPLDVYNNNVVINVDGNCDFSDATITSNIIRFMCRAHNNMYVSGTNNTQFQYVWWLAGDIVFNFDMGAKIGAVESLPVKNEAINVTPVANFNASNIEGKNFDYTFTLNFNDGNKTYNYVEVADGNFKPLTVKSNLTLYSDFTYNVYLPASLGVTEAFLGENALNVTEVLIGGKTYVRIEVAGIAANAIAEKLTVTVNSEYYDNFKINVSVLDYANALLAGTYSDASKTLMYAALNYTASAYTYAGADNAALTALLAEYAAYAPAKADVADVATDKGETAVAIESAQLALSTDLKLVFNLKADYNGTLTVQGTEYTVVDGQVDGKTYVVVALRAYELYDTVITITAGEAQGTYALADYIASNEDASVAAVLEALNTYCFVAKSYRTTNPNLD